MNKGKPWLNRENNSLEGKKSSRAWILPRHHLDSVGVAAQANIVCQKLIKGRSGKCPSWSERFRQSKCIFSRPNRNKSCIYGFPWKVSGETEGCLPLSDPSSACLSYTWRNKGEITCYPGQNHAIIDVQFSIFLFISSFIHVAIVNDMLAMFLCQ